MTNFDSTILVVEDCPEDYDYLIDTLKKWKIGNPIVRCQTGDDALDFLYAQGKYAGRAAGDYPVIILLDLNLPGTDGREVLAEIKKDKALKYIPVIIMSSSENEQDARNCYRRGAHAYLPKPLDPQCLITTMCHVEGYAEWQQVTPDGGP